jgi:hypothetical protein
MARVSAATAALVVRRRIIASERLASRLGSGLMAGGRPARAGGEADAGIVAPLAQRASPIARAGLEKRRSGRHLKGGCAVASRCKL